MARPSWIHGFFTLALGILALQPASAAAMSPLEGISKAGLQRMLSQRIVKTYCQIGQEVDVMEGTKELKEAVEQFDRQLGELKELATDAESSAVHAKMVELWGPTKQIATQGVSRDKAELLYADGEKLLEAANKFTELVVQRGNNEQARIVNAAGRQRMLAHRVAASYLMLSWGFTDARYRSNYDTAAAEFEDNMIHLSTSQHSSPEVNDLLKQVSKKWGFYKNSSKIETGKFYAGMVVKLLDKIYAMMGEITDLYIASK